MRLLGILRKHFKILLNLVYPTSFDVKYVLCINLDFLYLNTFKGIQSISREIDICNRVYSGWKKGLTLFVRMGEFVLVPKFAAKMTLHIFCDISWSWIANTFLENIISNPKIFSLAEWDMNWKLFLESDCKKYQAFLKMSEGRRYLAQ